MEQSIGRRKAEFIEAGRTAWRVARGRQARRRISSYATFLLAMPASWKALSDVPSTKSWRGGSSPVDLDRSVAEMTEEPRESGAIAEEPAVAEPQQAEAAGADKGTPGACGADASRSPTPRRASRRPPVPRASDLRRRTCPLPKHRNWDGPQCPRFEFLHLTVQTQGIVGIVSGIFAWPCDDQVRDRGEPVRLVTPPEDHTVTAVEPCPSRLCTR